LALLERRGVIEAIDLALQLRATCAGRRLLRCYRWSVIAVLVLFVLDITA
jgi:hypothetical protein